MINLQDCDKIVSMDHTMMKPLLLKADVLLKLGQLEESRVVYNPVLQVEPDNEKAREGARKIETLQQT